MFRRIIVYVVSIFLAGLCLALVLVPDQTVEITQGDIDEALKKQIPYRVEKALATVTIRKATVQLTAQEQLLINAEFDARAALLEGVAAHQSPLQCDMRRGSFTCRICARKTSRSSFRKTVTTRFPM